ALKKLVFLPQSGAMRAFSANEVTAASRVDGAAQPSARPLVEPFASRGAARRIGWSSDDRRGRALERNERIAGRTQVLDHRSEDASLLGEAEAQIGLIAA